MKFLKLSFLIWLIMPLNFCFSYPINFIDDTGKAVIIENTPQRVVSLMPSITEILFKIKADKNLKGITFHSVFPGNTHLKTIVGGFLSPSIKKIVSLNPDLIFVSNLHTTVKKHFANKDVKIIELKNTSIEKALENIMLLGKIFDKENKAYSIKKSINENLALIKQKLKFIDIRKRVMRIMGKDKLYTPGSNSFQQQIIQMAGGIPHDFKRDKSMIEVSKEELQQFNPEVIYGCYQDLIIKTLNLQEFKNVDAIKNNKIYYFPCELICRASSNIGYFVQWLSASIYQKEFANTKNLVFKDKKIEYIENHFKQNLKSDYAPDYVKQVRIAKTRILDFTNKSLIINFKTPMKVLSSLEGQKDNITNIVNHYTPPQNWMIDHAADIDSIKKRINSALDLDKNTTSILITGVDMDNVSIKKQSFKNMKVYAFVTAGVKSNAMRMSKSKGLYYELDTKSLNKKSTAGTINIILMTNMHLSKKAMIRAMITITEAKTAALLDMDIRTSYDKGKFKATGTGTDNILIVQGKKVNVENTGGHTKLGELIAKAVYNGVIDAVFKQNGISTKRNNIFDRLEKRGIFIYNLVEKEKCGCSKNKNQFVHKIEELLLIPKYSGFIQMALSISDDYEKNLIKDISAFKQFANLIALKISNGNITTSKDFIKTKMPHVIKIALNALFNGIYYRDLNLETSL